MHQPAPGPCAPQWDSCNAEHGAACVSGMRAAWSWGAPSPHGGCCKAPQLGGRGAGGSMQGAGSSVAVGGPAARQAGRGAGRAARPAPQGAEPLRASRAPASPGVLSCYTGQLRQENAKQPCRGPPGPHGCEGCGKEDMVGAEPLLQRRSCRVLDGWGLEGPRKDEQLRPAGRAVLLVSRLLHARSAQRRSQARAQNNQHRK